MADQTIEIKLILRDELSKQLAPIAEQLKQINQVKLDQPRQEFQAFGRTVQAVHRELSTLARISLGGLIGGGVVASIFAVGRALSEMASRAAGPYKLALTSRSRSKADISRRCRRFPPLPPLTTDLKLPKFAAAHGRMFAWPPERKCFSVLAG